MVCSFTLPLTPHSFTVIAFAGDALICLFAPISEDHGDPSQCCLRAIHCGNELKFLKTNTLSAHIAIDYGTARLALIGGYNNQWTHIYDGECFACLGQCVNDAGYQELVISSSLNSIIEDCSDSDTNALTYTRLSSGNYLVDFALTTIEKADSATEPPLKREDSSPDLLLNVKVLKSLMVEQLRSQALQTPNKQLYSFIPAPILSHITHNKQLEDSTISPASELRRVTCVFVKFDSYYSSYPLDDLQHCFYHWQETILKRGGYIRQIVTDDKGCVLIALWGVPTASHVNDTLLALSAVSEITIFCQQEGYEVSIGVTTGEVYCGMIGSNSRCDYAAIGSSINFSARLMAKAQGQIYLDESTYFLFENSFPQCGSCTIKLSSRMEFKGRSGTDQVYQFFSQQYLSISPLREGMKNKRTFDMLLIPEKSSAHLCLTPPTLTSISRLPSLDTELLVTPETMTSLQQTVKNLLSWKGEISIVDELDEDHKVGRSDESPHSPLQPGDECVQLIHVTGSPGTGKTEVVTQMRQLCETQTLTKITTVVLSLTELDVMSEYSVIRQLFSKLVMSDSNSISFQKKLITSLFLKTFPTTSNLECLRVKFRCVQQVLGFTWPLLLPTRYSFSSLMTKRVKNGAVVPLNALKDFIQRSGTDQSHQHQSGHEEEGANLDPIKVFSQFLVTIIRSLTPLAILLDESQHCDAASWSILFNLFTHLRAPILFLFTTTDTKRSPKESKMESDHCNMRLVKKRKDEKEKERKNTRSAVPFLNSQPSSLENMSITSMDPFSGDDSPALVTKQIQTLHSSPRPHPNITLIELPGLDKKQVDSLLHQFFRAENVSSTLVKIVTQICEGNAYWCQMIIEFILLYGEDSFCHTFCSQPSSSSSAQETSDSIQSHHMSSEIRSRSLTRRMNSLIEGDEVESISNAEKDEKEESEVLSRGGRRREEREAHDATTAANTILYRLITALLDRLTYQERELIKYASVCGTKFPSDLLHLVVPTSLADECDSLLVSLKRFKFMTSSTSPAAAGQRSQLNYSFISYRMRDIIYSLIPCSDASRIHYLVGKQMELLYQESGLETFYEALAFHYTMASLSPFRLTKEEFFQQTLSAPRPLRSPHRHPRLRSRPSMSLFSRAKSFLSRSAPIFPTSTSLLSTLSPFSTVSPSSSPPLHNTPSPSMMKFIPTTSYSSYLMTIYDLVKRKSYEFSFLAAKQLFIREAFRKSVAYLSYATQAEAMDLLGEAHRQEVAVFISEWLQHISAEGIEEERADRSLHWSLRSQSLLATSGCITALHESLAEE
jgi:hypothetical protein